MTSGHEGFPGHFLPLSIAKHNTDAVRRFAFDSVFAEGWAFYEESLLRQMGLYGDDLDGRYAVAQFERLRGARAIVDAKMATGEWPFDQALKWFQTNAGVDADTARGEVSRFALGPGQAFDYAVGRTQILDLLAKYKAKKGAAFSLQAFHDDLLSHGTVPVAIIASEMLNDSLSLRRQTKNASPSRTRNGRFGREAIALSSSLRTPMCCSLHGCDRRRAGIWMQSTPAR